MLHSCVGSTSDEIWPKLEKIVLDRFDVQREVPASLSKAILAAEKKRATRVAADARIE